MERVYPIIHELFPWLKEFCTILDQYIVSPLLAQKPITIPPMVENDQISIQGSFQKAIELNNSRHEARQNVGEDQTLTLPPSPRVGHPNHDDEETNSEDSDHEHDDPNHEIEETNSEDSDHEHNDLIHEIEIDGYNEY